MGCAGETAGGVRAVVPSAAASDGSRGLHPTLWVGSIGNGSGVEWTVCQLHGGCGRSTAEGPGGKRALAARLYQHGAGGSAAHGGGRACGVLQALHRTQGVTCMWVSCLVWGNAGGLGARAEALGRPQTALSYHGVPRGLPFGCLAAPCTWNACQAKAGNERAVRDSTAVGSGGGGSRVELWWGGPRWATGQSFSGRPSSAPGPHN